MKLILISFLALSFLCACEPRSEQDFTITHFSHSGHDYIYFNCDKYGYSVLHDPDCQLKDLKK